MAHRILSLDGGGTWAILQAMALQAMFGDVSGHTILAQFDLAVANSGGSIVLGGLIENKSPSQIITFFDNAVNREAIFKKVSPLRTLLSHIPAFPKYSADGKLAGLRMVFGPDGETPMDRLSTTLPKGPNGAPVRILITAFDYDALRAVLFRSYRTKHGATPSTDPLVSAVHASSDAPVVFFDGPADFGARRYWDGAMAGFNNPVMAGVADLLSDGVRAEDLVVLSLGTGTVKLAPADAKGDAASYLRQKIAPHSVLQDLSKVGGCVNDDPPDNASFTAHVVIASACRTDPTQMGKVVRLSPVVRPVFSKARQTWDVPTGLDSAQFTQLSNMRMDAVADDEVQLLKTLGQAWIAGGVPNQPIRMTSDTLASAPGDDNFAGGVARWNRL